MAFTTASTIGYGWDTPQTATGKAFTFLYGFPAIALFGLSIVNIGSAITAISISIQLNLINNKKLVSLLIFIIWIILIIIGSIILSYIEDGWTFSNGLYFMWISLSTIGYGDYQPKELNKTYWFIHILIWFGLAVGAVLVGSVHNFFLNNDNNDIYDININNYNNNITKRKPSLFDYDNNNNNTMNENIEDDNNNFDNNNNNLNDIDMDIEHNILTNNSTFKYLTYIKTKFPISYNLFFIHF